MEGLFINKSNMGLLEAGDASAGIRLLAKRDELEIMTQSIIAGATVWLTPADTEETMEFFFVHSGELEMLTGEGPTRIMPGESFYISGLKQEVRIRALTETLLFYVSNSPIFESTFDFQSDLIKLVHRIDDKDHYTYRHSLNVMHYAVQLFESMGMGGEGSGISMDDIVVASLFHDVGKCYVPDEILKSRLALTPAEFREIVKHPIASARLLRPNFSERIAEVAQDHHERLDGSGYPFGLTGDDLSLEARILAVADVFDAMTTDRGYNRVKTFAEAAAELAELKEKFDSRVTRVLMELVESGTIDISGGSDT